ncbi:MAG: membrane dipeptidase [Clostridia bacterium]|nr:membrane dipeptidase [Clostridia bacterium]
MIPLFDLHCDTLLKLFYNNLTFDNKALHINKNDFANFSPYIQVLSIWSDNKLDNKQSFDQYKKILNYSKALNIRFSQKPADLDRLSFILGVEDARLLNGNINRLYSLASDGVKILTLNWQNESIIGGAWNTNLPLSKFGYEVLIKCFELNIIPDLSHSSYFASMQALEYCLKNKKSILFSHSNSYAVCNHKRNIDDNAFVDIINTNSLVGLSLVCEHLSDSKCSIDSIIEHIYHFLCLGGENCIALGCDFDGTATLPTPIYSIKDLVILYDRIEKEFGRTLAQKIFFFNAYNFYCKNII